MWIAAAAAFAAVALYGYAVVRANRELNVMAGDE